MKHRRLFNFKGFCLVPICRVVLNALPRYPTASDCIVQNLMEARESDFVSQWNDIVNKLASENP